MTHISDMLPQVKKVPKGLNYMKMVITPFSATRRYKRHQNKVKVKGLSRNSSYLAGFSIFFFLMVLKKKKKKIGLALKRLLQYFRCDLFNP